MDNFKLDQLSDEEAMMVIGSSKGRGRRGGRKGFLSTLSEADQATVKAAVAELKGSAGWMDLSRTDRKAQIKAIIEPFKQG